MMMQEKENVLVYDEKGGFLKLFEKELSNQFNFSESCFFRNNQLEANNFERFVFVVYNKSELFEFLKLKKKGLNILVCLFNEVLYDNLAFLKEINDLILLTGYKTKAGIIRDFKQYLKKTSEIKKTLSESGLSESYITQTNFQNCNKVLFFFT